MTRAWPWIRAGVAAVLLGLVVWRLGAGPFLDGARSVNLEGLAAAAAIGLVTTCCAAARWSAIAGGIGISIGFRAAVAACYRAQFLNSVLPGGVVGDVHRGLRHGRDRAAVGLGLRAVAWDRLTGQAVQIAFTAAVLALTSGPMRGVLPWLLVGLAAGAAVVLVLLRPPHGGHGRRSRATRVVVADLRAGVLDRRRLPLVAATSTLVVAGHATTMVVAARAVGIDVSLGRLVPVALVVLAAMSVPASIGGWGPREGVAGWAFAASGWGAAQGVATATAYGVMALVATLPGAVLQFVGPRRRRGPRPADPPGPSDPAVATPGSAAVANRAAGVVHA
jgi:uncharacterized membrane protein YbhN (UPF0104 family)